MDGGPKSIDCPLKIMTVRLEDLPGGRNIMARSLRARPRSNAPDCRGIPWLRSKLLNTPAEGIPSPLLVPGSRGLMI